MTLNRSSQRGRASFRTALVILGLLPAAMTPALASPRHAPRAPTTYDAIGAVDRDETGSLPSVRNPAAPPRALRSSTLGNAEFPERDPIAQNLGNTSGGSLN